jgi:hypothetical protein
VNLTRIEGSPITVHCDGCNRDGVAGQEPYTSASQGKVILPEDWYTNENSTGVYCATCAAKLVQTDPTRSVTQFYTDTKGEKIDPQL